MSAYEIIVSVQFNTSILLMCIFVALCGL